MPRLTQQISVGRVGQVLVSSNPKLATKDHTRSGPGSGGKESWISRLLSSSKQKETLDNIV